MCGDDVKLAEVFRAAMVVVSGFDLIKDQHTRYVDAQRRKLKAVRVVEYSDTVHDFHVFPELTDSGKFVTEMKLSIQEHRIKHDG
jgi:acetyl esterase/lipase